MLNCDLWILKNISLQLDTALLNLDICTRLTFFIKYLISGSNWSYVLAFSKLLFSKYKYKQHEGSKLLHFVVSTCFQIYYTVLVIYVQLLIHFTEFITFSTFHLLELMSVIIWFVVNRYLKIFIMICASVYVCINYYLLSIQIFRDKLVWSVAMSGPIDVVKVY